MDDVERILKRQRTAAPSEELDRRMSQLFLDASIAPPPWYRRPIALWQCAAACMAFAVGGFLVADSESSSMPGEDQERVTHVYVIQAPPDVALNAINAVESDQRSLFTGPMEFRVETESKDVEEDGLGDQI